MDPRILDVGLGVVSVALWLGVYGLMLLVTRPRPIRSGPATQDLTDEPPAVVSLVANGWDLTEDAAESTLLDLGARRILEFRQPANDPMHTTIHIAQENPTGLTTYEKRVFDRVASLSVGGVVPLTALTFRDPRAAQAWGKRLRAEVIADARGRGLSRRRFGRSVVSVLTAVAAVCAAGVAAAAYRWVARTHEEDPAGTAFYAGIVAFAVLTAWGGRPVGERDTAVGREVAARWRGVQAWLRGHDAFADLPPSSVTVWDRYLSYGAALGVTRVSSAVIDLGMGSRKRVWSSFGGTWHRVRVRYPSFGIRHGASAPRLVIRALVAGALGYVLLRFGPGAVDGAADLVRDNPVTSVAGLIRLAFLALGVALLAHALYHVVRVAIDLAAPARLTGQVLWVQVWKQSSKSDSSATPTFYYLAVDDGKADRTTAWALPASMAGQCDVGDTVELSARPWSRRVLSVSIVERLVGTLPSGTVVRPSADLDGDGSMLTRVGHAVSATPADPGELLMQMFGLDGPSKERKPRFGELLSAEEASGALGIPLTRQEMALPGTLTMIHFTSVDRQAVTLVLQVSDGAIGRMVWRRQSRGTPLPGITAATGTVDAFTRGDQAVMRLGDMVAALTLAGPAKGRRETLPALLHLVATRLPAPASAPAPPPPA